MVQIAIERLLIFSFAHSEQIIKINNPMKVDVNINLKQIVLSFIIKSSFLIQLYYIVYYTFITSKFLCTPISIFVSI